MQIVSENMPLVSCIMPTYNRRLFVPQAIRYFLRQDYPRRELVIVDDGTDEVGDLIPDDERLRYIRLGQRASIGHKRNIAVEQGRGEIIAHWDDDDWYHVSYLGTLARKLSEVREQRAIAGLAAFLVYILENASLKVLQTGGVAGATFCYFKTLWERSPYRDVVGAEDYFFLLDSQPRRVPVYNPELFIIIRHRSHTWKEERGMDVTTNLKRAKNYHKRIDEVIGKDDYTFYVSARREFYPV